METGTDDFTNKDFKGNVYSFTELSDDLCQYLNTNDILKAYEKDGVNEVKIDPTKRFMGKNCDFTLLYNDPSKYSRGMISVVQDQGEDESLWEEKWESRKKIYKSASYVFGLGKAAIWIEKQRKLEIKMDGYTIYFTTPATYDKSFDYKTTAVNSVKNAQFFK